MASDPGRDVRAKALEFGVRTVRYVLELPPRPGVRILSDQLLRAGGGVGANLEEAKAASTRREFVRYVEIALRESRESLHWIRICSAAKLGDSSELERMQRQADELVRILTSIVLHTKQRTSSSRAAF